MQLVAEHPFHPAARIDRERDHAPERGPVALRDRRPRQQQRQLDAPAARERLAQPAGVDLEPAHLAGGQEREVQRHVHASTIGRLRADCGA
jgi:hypothetical protein